MQPWSTEETSFKNNIKSDFKLEIFFNQTEIT